ncbi:MAG TPA: polysaccharide deacetylase family protein [Polyangiales bacterium]|nr:polysaccharide deacetylase family protein [Polyangiales bacterium]
MPLCAVSVDLDEIPCYAAIHGLSGLPLMAAEAIYRAALPRIEALFDELDLRATFFAIGSDLIAPHAAAAIKRLAERGHEIANHSQDHLYDLTRRPRDEQRRQIETANRMIADLTGRAPVGFRAPGYTIDDRLFALLAELGFAYDSSVFPCPTYYIPKLLVIQTYRALGRPTRSVVDHPRVLTAPADPYRVGTPYSKRGHGLLELPIGVTRDATGRLPFIGTSVTVGGTRGARVLSEWIAGRPLVNLELHGIDGADAELDGLQSLRPHQPDLQRTAAAKLAALKTAISTLRRLGYRFVTLAEAAQSFGDQ